MAASENTPMLEVKNLGISFGGLRAVDNFNMTIEKGQLYGLIGPNGAGKTTIFNMLTGVYKPTDGKICLDGEDITGKSTMEINKEGIARTFQNIRLFSDLTVLDNVKAGLHNQKDMVIRHSHQVCRFDITVYKSSGRIPVNRTVQIAECFQQLCRPLNHLCL